MYETPDRGVRGSHVINRTTEPNVTPTLRQFRFLTNPITWAAATLACNLAAVVSLIGGAR